MLWELKEPCHGDDFNEHPKHMFQKIKNKIITIFGNSAENSFLSGSVLLTRLNNIETLLHSCTYI